MNPIVDVVSGFMSGVVKPILDKWIPDAQQRLEASELIQTQLQQLNLGQIEINKVEAASSSLFVAGWRPYLGWGCGTAFIYSVLIEPIMRWVATVIFHYAGTFPLLDSSLTMQVLFALLGMAGLRTYEKIQGTASGPH